VLHCGSQHYICILAFLILLVLDTNTHMIYCVFLFIKRVLVQCFFCALAKIDTQRKLTIALAVLYLKIATVVVFGLSTL